MSEAYIYNADIYCSECAIEITERLNKVFREQAEAEVDVELEGLEARLGIDLSDSPKMRDRLIAKRSKVLTPDTQDESTYDSGEYPKGPYGDGGGESDSPQHCGACHEFLENSLTSDGAEYVRANQRDEWDSFYGISRDTEQVE